MKELRYIGIDDTDNLETRGTGYRAGQLIELLQGHNLAQGVAVTRHQLLVDDRVPYTSHNSSACIVIRPRDGVGDDQLLDFCRGFLLDIAAEGADVGLCLAGREQAREVVRFGIKAKTELVQQDEAHAVARRAGVRLEGLTGTHQGVIGSLSAVGLHVHGNDGRYIWPREIREYAGQIVTMPFLKIQPGIDRISLLDGRDVDDESARVSLGDWPRTVRIDHHAVLLVEPFDVQHQYKVLEKTVLKTVRP